MKQKIQSVVYLEVRSIPFTKSTALKLSVLFIILMSFVMPTQAQKLKILKKGLGSGSVSNSDGINCGNDCDETYGLGESVDLLAVADPGSEFVGWEGDATGASLTTNVMMDANRSVIANFRLTEIIPELAYFTPDSIQAFLGRNLIVNTPARFLKALPREYKQNWILMTRSESLQTGTAQFPRILLPSADSKFVFSIGMVTSTSFPSSHPNAIEYMQWDQDSLNFRFHEIVLKAIPEMDIDGDGIGLIEMRPRSVIADDKKCTKCHSTRNVFNESDFPGTTGLPIGLVQAKNKPNWDAYDSWGGALPFNRDRIYQGSIEDAAFRSLLNLWNWRSSAVNDSVRQILEQLELQAPYVLASSPHSIIRDWDATTDLEHIRFGFDGLPAIPTTSITTNYSFDREDSSIDGTPVTRGGRYVTLRHSNPNPVPGSSNDNYGDPVNDEGRAVQFFDLLGGLDGTLNQQRIADELINHRYATGSIPIDVRPIALAITKSNKLRIDAITNTVVSTIPDMPLTIDLEFFNQRNGMRINELVNDTRERAFSLPRRKADIQRSNLDRMFPDGIDADTDPDRDLYLADDTNGLMQQYGGTVSMRNLRQDIFRRPIDLGSGDRTLQMDGIYVDREFESNVVKIALYRYFLEPMGVSVDKWSMGVRGRSRTYTFADILDSYLEVFEPQLIESLLEDRFPGLIDPNNDAQLIDAINLSFSDLPGYEDMPKYTDVQRIFNKACIECHGGLDYPPYSNYGSYLDLSEDEKPPPGMDRLGRAYERAIGAGPSSIYAKITELPENCPLGVMPCGGPALSKTDIETIRRWIEGSPSTPYTHGDPHIKTIDGKNYDFQAAGEFVLLRGQSIEIQVRQKAVATNAPLGPNNYTGLTSCVSINTAVAVKIGRHRISFQPNLNGEPDQTGLELRIDGKLMQLGSNGIPLESGGRIIETTAPGGIQIQSPGGTIIEITPGWWNHYQLWYLSVNLRHVRATEGLMGSVAPRNWLPALPDGTLLGPRPENLSERYQQLYGEFGRAWRVTDSISLFDYASGTSTETYTIESWPNGISPQSCELPTGQGSNIPPQNSIPLEEARGYCSKIVNEEWRANCIKDVMATGEAGFAQNYLLAEEIALNVYPTAPKLTSPDDFVTHPVGPVTFTWDKATDANDDPITYKFYIWPVDDSPNINNATLVPMDAVSGTSSKFFIIIIIFIVLLLLLIIFLSWRKNRILIVFMIFMVLAAIVIAYYIGGEKSVDPVSYTVSNLEPGKAYFWKVIAEDDKGGRAESIIFRLEIE